MKNQGSAPRQFPPSQARTRNTSIQRLDKKVTKQSPTKEPRKQKNKSVEYQKKRKQSIQVKTKFQISSSHMGFLIQQQKTTDLATIRSSVALNHYYQALLSLFGVIYTSSQIIASNLFEHKKQTTGLSGLRFIGVLFSMYQFAWNQANLMKLKIMAKNVMKMGSTCALFSQKIQFVCRKITLNFNMQRRIQMAFLNTQLDSFWSSLISLFKFTDQIEMLDEMYETAPQKMAYWDFSFFVNKFLSEESFYSTIKQANKYRRKQHQEQDTLPHNFTYEFLIIEIFCFHQEEADREEESRYNEARTCQLI